MKSHVEDDPEVMGSSLSRSDVAVILGDLILSIDAGEFGMARDIAFLPRDRLIGEIVLEEREGIAETHGVDSVTH